MGVTCQILLTSNTKGVYRAGETVQGSVKYIIDKPTEFNSVILSLRGKGLCWWAPLISHATTSYTGSEDYVDQRLDLLQSKVNGTVTIPAGTYEKYFRFTLPEEIPSSYKDFRCFIAYFIELKFVKPNLKCFSKTFIVDIKVLSVIKPPLVQPVVYEAKKDFSSSQKSIILKVELERTFLYSGEDIIFKYDINNQSADVNVISITIELKEYTTYKSNCKHEKQKIKIVCGSETKVSSLSNNIIPNLRSSPQAICTSSEIYSIHSNIFTREYQVRVVLKFDFPHKDLCLEIPVAIAEKNDELAEAKLNDQPPSYWQVMNEKKK